VRQPVPPWRNAVTSKATSTTPDPELFAGDAAGQQDEAVGPRDVVRGRFPAAEARRDHGPASPGEPGWSVFASPGTDKPALAKGATEEQAWVAAAAAVQAERRPESEAGD
jgi:hypothetical protein